MPQPPPVWLMERAAIDHAVYLVPNRVRVYRKRRLLALLTAWASICAVLPSLALAWLVPSALWVSLGLAAASAGLAAVFFAFASRTKVETSEVSTRPVRVDARGLTHEGHLLRWEEIDSLAVEPYPHVDQSHVYAVVARTPGTRVYLAGGLPRAALEDLSAFLSSQVRARRTGPDAPIDAGAREELDRLFGLLREPRTP